MLCELTPDPRYRAQNRARVGRRLRVPLHGIMVEVELRVFAGRIGEYRSSVRRCYLAIR